MKITCPIRETVTTKWGWALLDTADQRGPPWVHSWETEKTLTQPSFANEAVEAASTQTLGGTRLVQHF